MRFYTTLDTREINGLKVVVDYTYEEIDPWDQLSECFESKEQLYADIDSGKYEWFMLRARAFFNDHEVGCDYLGGMLYENPRECLTDGSAASVIEQALYSAELELNKLREALSERAVA